MKGKKEKSVNDTYLTWIYVLDHASIIHCKTCGTEKKLLAGPQVLFSQRPENIVEKGSKEAM